MHSKISLSIQGLKLSNSTPGCRVSVLNFCVKQIPHKTFWHRAQSDKSLFQLLIPGLIPRFTAGKGNEGLILSRNSETPEKRPLFTSIVYGIAVRARSEKKSITSRGVLRFNINNAVLANDNKPAAGDQCIAPPSCWRLASNKSVKWVPGGRDSVDYKLDLSSQGIARWPLAKCCCWILASSGPGTESPRDGSCSEMKRWNKQLQYS